MHDANAWILKQGRPKLKKVLITTSGIGSRLGEFTLHTNKALAPVGNMPVISHIIDSYTPEHQFVVTLGHFGDHVREYLEMVYPQRNFHFVEVDIYAGNGSSLGYSMLKAESYLQEPFIFHAADSIVFENPNGKETNWVGGAKFKLDASQYSTFDELNGKVHKMNFKGMNHFDYIHIGIVGIFSFKEFWFNLNQLYEQDSSDSSLSDVHVINQMIKQGIDFHVQKFQTWKDSGNISSLNKTRQEFKSELPTLEKSNEAIYMVGGEVIKFFSDSNVCKKRVQRAKILSGLVPSISSAGNNFYSYPFVNGNVISEKLTTEKFISLLEFLKERLWKIPSNPINISQWKKMCEEFYVAKTRSRLNDFLIKTGIKDEDNVINGLQVPSAEKLIENIASFDITAGVQSVIHGDLILDNIIHSGETFQLIDWRHEFAGEVDIGDIYYDLAKLRHSLILNHEILLGEGFSMDSTGGGRAPLESFETSRIRRLRERFQKILV